MGETEKSQGKYWEIQNTRILLKQREFPNYNDQGYYDICHKISRFSFEELNVSGKPVLHMKHPQIIEVGTGKICGQMGKTQGILK